MIRRPVRPSLKPIKRYTPIRRVGPAKAKRVKKYQAFIAGPVWRRMRLEALERAAGRCERCCCDLLADDAPSYHLHHKTYVQALGNERPEDLEVLCHPCHAAHHRRDWWKDRRTLGYITKHGYRRKRTAKGLVFEHRIIAARVLGRPLPQSAVVHHVDGDKLTNKGGNLVVCESQGYHILLHVRQRAFLACGDPSKRQCYYCREWDVLEAMSLRNTKPKHDGTGRRHHLSCAAKWQADYRARHPRPRRTDYPWATTTHCRHGHEWTVDTARINEKGVRVCRQCDRERTKKSGDRHKTRAAAVAARRAEREAAQGVKNRRGLHNSQYDAGN